MTVHALERQTQEDCDLVSQGFVPLPLEKGQKQIAAVESETLRTLAILGLLTQKSEVCIKLSDSPDTSLNHRTSLRQASGRIIFEPGTAGYPAFLLLESDDDSKNRTTPDNTDAVTTTNNDIMLPISILRQAALRCDIPLKQADPAIVTDNLPEAPKASLSHSQYDKQLTIIQKQELFLAMQEHLNHDSGTVVFEVEGRPNGNYLRQFAKEFPGWSFRVTGWKNRFLIECENTGQAAERANQAEKANMQPKENNYDEKSGNAVSGFLRRFSFQKEGCSQLTQQRAAQQTQQQGAAQEESLPK